MQNRRHLVPIVKSVIDPTKGLINRTYHVKPEELKTILRERQGKSTVGTNFIKNVKDIDKIKTAVLTNDVTYLRDVFPPNSKVWANVLSRTNNFSVIASHKEHRNKLNQNIYGFILTGEPTFKDMLRNNMLAAYTIDSVTTKDVYTAPSSKIRESASEINDPFTIINNYNFDIEDLPDLSSDDLNEVYKYHVDYGNQATFKSKVIKKPDAATLSTEISKVIAFSAPSPDKVASIVSEFIEVGTAEDTTSVSQNLVIPQYAILANKEFWSKILSKFCIDGYDRPLVIRRSVLLYNMLLLSRIDQKRFSNVHTSYANDELDYLVKNAKNLEDILSQDVISFDSKIHTLATLSTKKIDSIIKLLYEQTNSYLENNEEDKAIDLIAATSMNFMPDQLYGYVKYIDPEFFNPEKLLDSIERIQMNNEDIDIFYLLAQIAAAKKLNMHYMPYNLLKRLKTSVFSATLVNKLLPLFIQRHVDTLFKDRPQYTQDVSIFIKLPDVEREDNQIFMKIEPISFHSITPIENSYEIKIPGSSIFKRNDDSVGVLNLMKYL